MIFIRCELWPKGDSAKARVLGEATISNAGSGSVIHGNYSVILSKVGGFKGGVRGSAKNVWRTGAVINFPRKALGVWDLLYRALGGVLDRRNPVQLIPEDAVVEPVSIEMIAAAWVHEAEKEVGHGG